MMFKNAGILLIFALFSIQSFAISPGAGQAQIRNNMQVMEQNKKRIQQHKHEEEVLKQQKIKVHKKNP